MKSYKGIKLPTIKDFSVPIYVDNNKPRRESTNRYFEESFKEANSFLKVGGLIIDEKLVKFVDCPVCNSKNKKELFVKWGFRISTCIDCNHSFVENQLKSSVLEKLYATSEIDELFQERSVDKDHMKYMILFYNKYLQYFSKFINKEGSLLDVGAGDGKFIEFLDATSSYKLSAMEFSEKSADFIKNIVGEENFYNTPITNSDFKGEMFNIITILGVLEHMDSPLTELSKCKEILLKDGRIIALVPNFESRAFKILGINTPTINPRSHLQYYTYNSFEKLADNAGFEIDAYFQELPVIDLMYDFISYSEELLESILKDNESYRSVYILKHKTS